MKNEIRDYIKANTKQGNVYLGIIGGGWGRWAVATGLSNFNPWIRVKSQNITAIVIFTNLEEAGQFMGYEEGGWMRELEMVYKSLLKAELGRCPWFKSNTELYGDFDSHIEALQWLRNFLSTMDCADNILYNALYLDHLT